jgi:hypothetical protein
MTIKNKLLINLISIIVMSILVLLELLLIVYVIYSYYKTKDLLWLTKVLPPNISGVLSLSLSLYFLFYYRKLLLEVSNVDSVTVSRRP